MSGILSLFKKNKEVDAGKGLAGEQNCIGCNVCLEVCEEGLWPALLVEYAKAGKYDDCQKYGIDYCSDCGTCTYQCSMEIPLFKYLRIARILSFYRGMKSGLIPVLLEVQANFGYLPKETIHFISDFLNLPEGHIYSVASFYRRLRLSPPGRQHIRICQGTACHISDGPHILREVEEVLGIKEGETSSDLEYTLDSVACIGCCVLAPCLTANDKVHGKMNDEKLRELLGAVRVRDGNDQ
ncbi:NAD(P)H-dependent oxidoreductase subunit E [Chloroflexota bacterium]